MTEKSGVGSPVSGVGSAESGPSIEPAGFVAEEVLDASQVALRDLVIEAIRTCYDPEIPVNIYELGLIYEVNLDAANNVEIAMTLTSPHCPVAESLPVEVEKKVRTVEGVAGAKVRIVWEPTWTPDRMSEAAKLELGMF